MKTLIFNRQSFWLGCFLFFVFLVALDESASAEIIPSARRITWEGNVGISGDIPNRTTIFASVKDSPYNAAGNGTTDDTSAIQNAINACPPGQVVHIPAGTYKISSKIRIKSGITVRGDGKRETILKGVSGFTSSYLVGFESTNYSSSDVWETSKSMTGGLTKGSTRITVAVSWL